MRENPHSLNGPESAGMEEFQLTPATTEEELEKHLKGLPDREREAFIEEHREDSIKIGPARVSIPEFWKHLEVKGRQVRIREFGQ